MKSSQTKCFEFDEEERKVLASAVACVREVMDDDHPHREMLREINERLVGHALDEIDAERPMTEWVGNCPECGAPAWRRTTKTPPYRCQNGHEFEDQT